MTSVQMTAVTKAGARRESASASRDSAGLTAVRPSAPPATAAARAAVSTASASATLALRGWTAPPRLVPVIAAAKDGVYRGGVCVTLDTQASTVGAKMDTAALNVRGVSYLPINIHLDNLLKPSRMYQCIMSNITGYNMMHVNIGIYTSFMGRKLKFV